MTVNLTKKRLVKIFPNVDHSFPYFKGQPADEILRSCRPLCLCGTAPSTSNTLPRPGCPGSPAPEGPTDCGTEQMAPAPCEIQIFEVGAI